MEKQASESPVGDRERESKALRQCGIAIGNGLAQPCPGCRQADWYDRVGLCDSVLLRRAPRGSVIGHRVGGDRGLKRGRYSPKDTRRLDIRRGAWARWRASAVATRAGVPAGAARGGPRTVTEGPGDVTVRKRVGGERRRLPTSMR